MFWTVDKNGGAEYWETSKLEMTIEETAFYALDVCHRSFKQFTGVECAQNRLEVSPCSHISLAICAFVRLKVQRLHSGVPWLASQTVIVRSAMYQFLTHPTSSPHATA